MRTEDFNFILPEENIAQYPVNPRDSSKLLVVRDEGIEDKIFTDLEDYLGSGDVLVFNNTKVIPARIFGVRGEAKIEVTLFKRVSEYGDNLAGTEVWECLIKNSKRLKAGDEIKFAEDFRGVVKEKRADGKVLLDFAEGGLIFMEKLDKYGNIPLPPYIRKGVGQHQDKQDYQTVYAKETGAIAAPTAGLHFTDELLARLREKGIEIAFLTLHVGGGTFLPVKVEHTHEHIMHSEYGEISEETAMMINAAKRRGNKVISIGTTSLRLLESMSNSDGEVLSGSIDTDIFITPGYKFKVIDMLVTNFHLPKSTLFMLVSAFCGLEEMKQAYNHAIYKGYRFYSYGDSSLLYKKEKNS